VAIRDILCEPDVRLKQISQTVTTLVPQTKQNIQDLIETFNSAPGVGIAMPQIGILERIVIIDATRQTRIKEKFQGQLILINPVLITNKGWVGK
jgi:peptide deformylase